MDILALLKIIIRRWIVVLPVIAIVAATGYNALSSMEPQYKATADVMLLAPTQSVDPTTGKVVVSNPFVDFRGGLNTTGVIIQTIVGDGDHHVKLDEQHLSGDYDVQVNERGAPIMSVSAKAEQPDIADATVAAVVNFISTELKTNQDALKVPAETRVTARLLTVSGAYPLAGDQTRVAAAVGAVGLAAIIGAALLAESLASSRTRRRGQRQDAELAALLAYPAGGNTDANGDATALVPNAPRPPRQDDNGDAVAMAAERFGAQDPDAGPGRARWKGGRKARAAGAGAPAQPPFPER